MRSVGYAASLREAVGWINKQHADDPHPNPPPFRGRERTEIVARFLNHLAGVAQPVKITVPRCLSKNRVISSNASLASGDLDRSRAASLQALHQSLQQPRARLDRREQQVLVVGVGAIAVD